MCIDLCQASGVNWNALEAVGTIIAALVAAGAIYHAQRLHQREVEKADCDRKDAAAVLAFGIHEELTVLRAFLNEVRTRSGGTVEGAARRLYEATLAVSLVQPVFLKRAALRLHLFGTVTGALLMAILSSAGRMVPNKDALNFIENIADETAQHQLQTIEGIAGALIQKIDQVTPLLGPFIKRAGRIEPH